MNTEIGPKFINDNDQVMMEKQDMRTLSYQPTKKRPILFWSDKLSRLDITEDVRTSFNLPNGTEISVVVWFYKTEGTDGQLKQRYHTSLSTSPDQDIPGSDLYQTDLGYICPQCKSNEFLGYRTELMPQQKKDECRFNRSDYGMYCRNCGTISV